MHTKAIDHLKTTINDAVASNVHLRIKGHGSKSILMNKAENSAPEIFTNDLSGVIDYQPTELMIQVGAGTSILELNEVLEASAQCLPCDAPMLQGKGSVGGSLASGLSGARRVAFGQIRDFVLGVHLLDGQARHMRFGGQVIKNVAGYDVSRLMAGSWGQFALFTEITFRTLPLPKADQTLMWSIGDQAAILQLLQKAVNKGLPISASVIHKQQLWVRFCGNYASVAQAINNLKNDIGVAITLSPTDAKKHWQSMQEMSATVFQGKEINTKGNWWRIALPPLTPMKFRHPLLENLIPEVIEWHGALRWFFADLSPVSWKSLQAEVSSLGGAAMAWSAPANTEHHATNPYPIITALSAANQEIHQSLKEVFDPKHIWI